MSQAIFEQIANELQVRAEQVSAAVTLLDDGNTVPFIARYRKEVTGGLDDTQLRTLDSRLSYLRELNERRASILKSINDQDKLTPELEQAILLADSKTRLEDLYLPYKQKRRTKGQVAIEAGLEPLADKLWQTASISPETDAQDYINADKGINDAKMALDGARAILMERLAEDAQLLDIIRSYLQQHAYIDAKVLDGKSAEGEKFHDYFAHQELITSAPSHRVLAMLRGRNEGILQLSLISDPNQEEGAKSSYCENLIAKHCGISLTNAGDEWRKQVIKWAWRIKISMHMETELMTAMKERAEMSAIEVFATNLKALLMAAPAGPKVTLGLDPGLRTGCKIAVVDGTGKVLGTDTIYPHAPRNQKKESLATLLKLINAHQVDLIAIGNGTASRESDELITNLIHAHKLKVQKIVVSEAGASVYSASELAAKEFPHLDVTLRGAVSIARRLQDPLAELVKIDPKAIGVGQYQHDVSQSQLAKRLDAVVEDCVNAVGVDVNTASVALLTRVAGLSNTLAENIVVYRDENGAFNSRSALKKIPRLGPKAFEQCAGFLRIMNGRNPLDSSGVHPESYPLVKTIAENHGQDIKSIIGNSSFLKGIKPQDHANERFGLPTVIDILKELDKPGRDPRPEFKTVEFAKDIHEIKDLKIGMVLDGVISNVANFGAFVDIGVHQDGLVHVSALSDQFVKDPHQVVQAGQIVKVKVMEVDPQRKRISLSMRLTDDPISDPLAVKAHKSPTSHFESTRQPKKQGAGLTSKKQSANGTLSNAFAEAFARAKK